MYECMNNLTYSPPHTHSLYKHQQETWCIVLIRSRQGDLQYAYMYVFYNSGCGYNECSFGGCFARLVEVTVNMKAGFNAVFDGLKKSRK